MAESAVPARTGGFRERMARMAIGTYVIWLRDLKRFWRDRMRRIGAFVQPLIYLFLLGTGLQAAFGVFGSGDINYVAFMYPGIVAMTILFTAVFSGISIIWDREFGFLKEMMVAPIPRTSVGLGKVSGGGTTAFMQGCILLVFMPLVSIPYSVEKIVLMLLFMLVLSMSLSSMGVLIAARMRSFEGFPIVINFILLPMFFLSGAMFPPAESAGLDGVFDQDQPVDLRGGRPARDLPEGGGDNLGSVSSHDAPTAAAGVSTVAGFPGDLRIRPGPAGNNHMAFQPPGVITGLRPHKQALSHFRMI